VSSSVQALIIAAAQAQGVDPSLALEVASAESNYNQNAVSSAGAIGVMQLRPSTAAQLGVNPYDLQQNIQGGVAYLRQLLSQFGDPTAAVAAYNCGPGCVSGLQAQYGSDWLSHAPGETQNYVAKIFGNVASQYTATLGPVGALASILNLPPALPAASAPGASTSVWTSMLIAAAVILGLGFVLDEA
jgi:soluble lytic murein transglycosylase-like protein